MKAARLGVLLSASVVTLALPKHMTGQAEAPCSLGARAEGGYGVNQKPGAPFLATAKETFEQKLPDGSVTRGLARFHQARNLLGATRNEAPQRCFRDSDGTLKLAYSVNTYDPSLRTSFYWSVYPQMIGWAENVVHVQRAPTVAAKEPSPKEIADTTRTTAAEQWSATEYKKEDLGTRVIHGLLVTGRRTVRTIPEGKEGNEQAIQVMDEHWWSDELGQDLVAIHDDPRVGRMTYEIEELTFGEPDAGLFVVPEGYVRKDVQPM